MMDAAYSLTEDDSFSVAEPTVDVLPAALLIQEAIRIDRKTT